MWRPSLFFISNRFYRMQNSFGPWNDHWRIFMGCHHGTSRAHGWHLAVTCNVTVAIVKTIVVVAYLPSNHTKLFLGLCNEKRVVKKTDRILCLVLDAISCVTWLIYRSHRRGGHGSNFLTALFYSGQSNSKLYVQKNNYVLNPPVELAHCFRHSKSLPTKYFLEV